MRTYGDYLRQAVTDSPTLRVRQWRSTDTIAAFGILGALEAMEEAPPSGAEISAAFDALRRTTHQQFSAVIPWQIGGVCSLTAVAASHVLGLPLLDGDLVGRAVSSLQQVARFDISQPVAIGLSSPSGDTVAFEARNSANLEDMARQLLSRGCGWMTFALAPRGKPWSDHDLVLGSVNEAARIGDAIQSSVHDGLDDSHLDALGIKAIGKGRVETNAVYRITEPLRHVAGSGSRHVRSHVIVDESTDAVIRLDAASEFLLAVIDGAVTAAAPDIISVFDSHTRDLLSPQEMRPGRPIQILTQSYGRHCHVQNDLEVRLGLMAYGLEEGGRPSQ